MKQILKRNKFFAVDNFPVISSGRGGSNFLYALSKNKQAQAILLQVLFEFRLFLFLDGLPYQD